MSEEKTSNFQTEPASPNVKRIVSIGTDPWQVKEFKGKVAFKRADAAQLKVIALDFNGYPAGKAVSGQQINLEPSTMYYLITR